MTQTQREFSVLHDAELINVSIDKPMSLVKMNFMSEDGSICRVELYGVKAFRSVDLTLQNVVNRVLRSSKNEISSVNINYWLEWVTSLSDASSWLNDIHKQEWLNNIKIGRIELVVIEPSAGTEIAVVCEKIILI